ncbi:MAG: glycine cleavage system aminomethyltransferase GcvT [Armatimonadota bacterium]|nr:glycine cleavage system aminomethyltransferase GcvT [Armatimonadota bacterium]MDR5696757.1 glycine cleavage system aminomethyltransferase GcvT [Armatimonadota bacterium]
MSTEPTLEDLRAAYEDFRGVAAALPDDLFQRKIRNWTPRDVVAHLVGWNRHTVTGCEQIRAGQLPFYLQDAAHDFANVNAESVRCYATTDRRVLLGELDASMRELEDYLRGLPAGAWDAGVGGGHGTVRKTVRALARDYVSHARRLAQWARERGAHVPERLERTPLYARHVALGARMTAFAGWEMPVQYGGIVEEHRAVRGGVGIFDVSHMGEFWITGPGALETIDRLLCNDPRRLTDGQAMYSPMCNPAGGILDDLIVYRVSAERFLMVVNAARHWPDLEWVQSHAQNCRVHDATYRTALLAVQGPLAEQVLQRMTGIDLAQIPYYHFMRGATVAGVRAIVSRTGYTGEDGFEIYTAWDEAAVVWDALVEAGVQPCGLGARDTLRLEAGYLLYGADMDEDTTPLEAGLGWTVREPGREFIGAQALRRQKAEGLRKKLCGLVVRDRAIARHGSPIFHEGERVGAVTSGSYGPWVDKNIALGYVPPSVARPGTEVQIEIRARRVAGQITKLPFYRRPRT